MAAQRSERAPVRLDALVLGYLRSRADLASASRTRYRLILLEFVARVGSGLDPRLLSRRHVERWLAGRTCAQSTKGHELTIVRGFCRWLALASYTPSEATLGVTIKRARSRRAALPPDAIPRVLAACPDARSRLVVHLLTSEALRPYEIAALRIGDVDFDHRTIAVAGRHARTLPITAETGDALREYLPVRPSGSPALIVREPPNLPGPLTPARVGDLVRSILWTSGVKQTARDGVDPMGLRYTGATLMIERGADPAGIGQVLGHRTLQEPDQQHRPWAERDLRTVLQGRR